MDYLFKSWNSLEKKLQEKSIFLFLDFDGTLAPIVSHPDKAKISIKVKNLLQRISLNSNCKIAIISGRSVSDIKKRIGVKNLIYSGNHGLEVNGPKISYASAASLKHRNLLRNIKDKLAYRLLKVKGIFIENKRLSLALHFRNVKENDIGLVKAAFREVTINLLRAKKIKIRPGKKVLEVSLPTSWNKGKVVLWLLAKQKIVLRGKEIVPIYIGDDLTDEDAFKSLRKKGITIFVGRNKPSYAQFYLKSHQDVFKFLERISK